MLDTAYRPLVLVLLAGCVARPPAGELRAELGYAIDKMEAIVRALERADQVQGKGRFDALSERSTLEADLEQRMQEFAEMLRDADRPALRAFGAAPETKRRHLPMAQLLMHSEEYDAAVDYLVPLLGSTEHPSYVMWKMFEAMFGAYPDYLERSRGIGRALLEHHDTHPDSRPLISRLFHDDIDSLRRSLRESAGRVGESRRSLRDLPTMRSLLARIERGEITVTGRLVKFRELTNWPYRDGLEGCPAAIRALDGQTVTMVGFPVPIHRVIDREFYLVRATFNCYSEPPEHHFVRVVSKKSVDMESGQPLRVEGRFRVSATVKDGFVEDVFQICDAQVSPIKPE